MCDNGETEGSNSESEPWAALIVGLIYEFIGKNKNEKPEDKYRASQDDASRKTAYATIAIAAFTAAILVLGYFQYRVTNGQLVVIQRQLDDSEIQEAASITLRNFGVNGFPDQPVISVDVVNVGRTRADQVTVDAGAYWVRGHDVLALLNQVSSQFGGRTIPNEFGFSIEPNETPHNIVLPIQPLPPPGMPKEAKLPTREEFVSGDVTTVLYVIGSYRDVFKNIHRVVDCGAHFPASKGAFISCFSSNRHYDNQQ